MPPVVAVTALCVVVGMSWFSGDAVNWLVALRIVASSAGAAVLVATGVYFSRRFNSS
jgi:hypothetical protein